MVNRVTCSAPVPSSILYVYACHPRGALPVYWACRMLSRAVGNSRGTRKLAQTPHDNNNKKKRDYISTLKRGENECFSGHLVTSWYTLRIRANRRLNAYCRASKVFAFTV